MRTSERDSKPLPSFPKRNLSPAEMAEVRRVRLANHPIFQFQLPAPAAPVADQQPVQSPATVLDQTQVAAIFDKTIQQSNLPGSPR